MWAELVTMATRRSTSRVKSSSNRRGSLQSIPSAHEQSEVDRLKQNEVSLKTTIRTLEVEVDTLKQRLDGLRKAKNTTIVKREREEVHIQPPQLGHHRQVQLPHTPSTSLYRTHQNSSQASLHSEGNTSFSSTMEKELLEQLEESRRERDKLTAELLASRCAWEEKERSLRGEIEEAKEMHAGTLLSLREELKQTQQAQAQLECAVGPQVEDLSKELEQLKKTNAQLSRQLESLVDANDDLRESNMLLQGKCETLMEDLSVKEARWSDREEKLKAEIRKQWGQRYHEWITKAEQKMEELQKINSMLQTMLKTKTHNPDL